MKLLVTFVIHVSYCAHLRTDDLDASTFLRTGEGDNGMGPALPANCFGIGVNMNRARAAIRRAFITCKGKQPILERAEALGYEVHHQRKSGCSWWRNDRTRSCATLFDCYLPPLTEIVDDPGLRSLFQVDKHNTVEEWAKLAQRMHDGHGAPPAAENCVAVHVRRGDICYGKPASKEAVQETRAEEIRAEEVDGPHAPCPKYDEYKGAVSTLFQEVQRETKAKTTSNHTYVYLMTDDAEFPFQEWSRSFPLEFNDMNRSQFHNKMPPETADERGLLGNHQVANVLFDLQRARRCKAFVGTFGAGLSREVYLLMLADRGYPPAKRVFNFFKGNNEEIIEPTLTGGEEYLKRNEFYQNLKCMED